MGLTQNLGIWSWKWYSLLLSPAPSIRGFRISCSAPVHHRNTSPDNPRATLHIKHQNQLLAKAHINSLSTITAELCSLLLSGSMNLQIFHVEHNNFGQMCVNHVPYSYTLREAPCLLGHIPGKTDVGPRSKSGTREIVTPFLGRAAPPWTPRLTQHSSSGVPAFRNLPPFRHCWQFCT